MKNVCGRLLVGLLWRRIILDNGEEEWIFKCSVDEEKNHTLNSLFFWGSMVIAIIVWGFLFMINILTFSFGAFIILIPFSLNLINLGSFIKCSKVQKKKATETANNLMTSFVAKQVKKNLETGQKS